MAKKTTTYNLILKEFTKINNRLPEDRKISIKERRKIIRETIYPIYKNVPQYKIRKKQVKALILKGYEDMPPKEFCDINYIDPSFYAYVEWFSLDETIMNLIPDCIYVKVSAGGYGETRIFSTREYDYNRNGVKMIVEAIREDANNESAKYVFSGYKKLRPRKKNDGTPENYYIDFVLYINEEPQADETEVHYDLPKGKEVRSRKKKVNNALKEKLKKLQAVKQSKKRAKKAMNVKISKSVAANNRRDKAQKPTEKMKQKATSEFLKAVEAIEAYYKKGKITKEQYEQAIAKLF